jgi:thioredoxin-like negative regulator of GroEL
MIEVLSEGQLEDLKTTHDVLLTYFSPPTCNVGESLFDKVVGVLEGLPVAAAQVDTSARPAIAGQHLVLAYPTIIVFVFGREFGRLSRIISIGDIEHMLDRAVAIVSDSD